jgi:uncharacterized protein YhaN
VPPPVPTATVAKREVLQGLAQVLGLLAGRLQTQSEAAREVGLLTGRAEELAAQAWALASAHTPAGSAATDLANAIAAFIEDAATLTQRAAHEATASRALAAILDDEAIELNAVGRALDGVNDMTLIRARLRPMLNKLVAVPERLNAMTEVAADVAGLGQRAREMAKLTEGLHENARNHGIAAVAIYRELRDFAEATSIVAARMSADDTRIRQSIAAMKDQADQLGSPEAAAAAQRKATAVGRMQTMIAQVAGQRAQPLNGEKLLRGMVWDCAPKHSRRSDR